MLVTLRGERVVKEILQSPLNLFLRPASNCVLFCLFPLQSLRKVGQDPIVLLMCITVFLSYLPEAGQYSCMFLYLKQVSHSQMKALLNTRTIITDHPKTKQKKPTVKISHMWTPFSVKREYFWKLENSPVTLYTAYNSLYVFNTHLNREVTRIKICINLI